MAKTQQEPLERSIVNCIETNAAMQINIRSNYWCGNWGDNQNCPYYNKDREHTGVSTFKGCDYKRKKSK